MGDANTKLTEAEARHLLRRSGFGARPRDVQRILKRGDTRGAMADRLVNFKPTRFRPRGNADNDSRDHWLRYLLRTPRQLQEKLVLFWHDHFATSADVVSNLFMRDQNRLLRGFCHGDFKSFVKAINVNAAMMDFLDTQRNSKIEPNENYPRELLELFALGVLDSNGEPNYEQEDIVQIARAFTGWRHDSKGQPSLQTDQHDFSDGAGEFPQRGPKVIFKTRGGFGPGGRSFTVNGQGAPEIDTVVDILFDHRDSDGQKTVARYVGRRLFEYFAYPNPAVAVLDEIIALSNFGNTWDVASFLRSLFVHDEFYVSAAPLDVAAAKSVKWPVDFVVGTYRQLGVKPKGSSLATQPVGTSRPLRSALDDMGQVLLEPPSVFGWDLELGWVSSFPMLSRYSLARDIAYAADGSRFSLRPSKLVDMTLSDPEQIVGAVADVLGIPDQITAEMRAVLVDYLTDGGAVSSINLSSGQGDVKLRGVFALLLQSPAYQLH
jgi:uncharacterized protein (DUF1800 family)